jgi:hypothetical protein
MRKNTQQAVKAWRAGKALRPAQSVWTDGTTIFSYGTALLTRRADGMLVMNLTKYSRTTTVHQNGLKYALLGEDFDSVTGAPFGYSAYALAGQDS